MSYAYVGCRTTKERNARGKGLKVFEINDKTGDWNLIQCFKDGGGKSIYPDARQ